jgi:hypothetical protein
MPEGTLKLEVKERAAIKPEVAAAIADLRTKGVMVELPGTPNVAITAKEHDSVHSKIIEAVQTTIGHVAKEATWIHVDHSW